MTKAQKIEIIVLTVADFYEVDWHKMWVKSANNQNQVRDNLFKLIRDYVSPSYGHEYINFSYAAFRRHANTADDLDYGKLKRIIAPLITHTMTNDYIIKQAS